MSNQASDEWAGGAPATSFPRQDYVDEELQERIRACLWQVGITEDPFADPEAGLRLAHKSKHHAAALYAAILHETKDRFTLTQTFDEWCRMLACPWLVSV